MSQDLADLDLDVDISVASPEDYQDNTPPPLPVGSYVFRLKDFGFEAAKTKGKPPTLLLKRVEVADGPHEGRVVMFQRVNLTPYDRKGLDGKVTKASGLADFLRSIDISFDTSFSAYETPEEKMAAVKQFLQNAIDNRLTFRAKADWEGFDKDLNTQLRAEQGIPAGVYPKDIEEKVKVTSKQFAGKPIYVNPHSGNKISAQVRLKNFYPQAE